MLTQRQKEILRLVVETYIATGEPVASRSVSSVPGLGLSSASVRSVMAELEEMGLLSQPHTSAGRLPTEQSFRLYVGEILEPVPPQLADRERILAACGSTGDGPDAALAVACETLAGLTPYACLVLAPRAEAAVLLRVEFLRLAQSRVLALLVTDSGRIQSRVFELDQPVEQKELDACGRELSSRLGGLTLKRLREVLEEEVTRDERAWRRLHWRLLQDMVAVNGLGGQLIVNGKTTLLGAAEAPAASRKEIARTYKLLRILEEKKLLIRLLDKCLEKDGVHLFIGAESLGIADDLAAGFAVVASQFNAGPERESPGTLAILGPTRLDYAQVVPLVDFTAKALSASRGAPGRPTSPGSRTEDD
ncbi:MAG: heat-inducible transcription repressor HrcA [Magnetococcales bacterium]|nr:heat-inducible transcription repressor HrcA [Magnetococcales bacterium]MBF0157699.1 heat-inducible transcription repressor HrcA [Magnetococcales bacterium]